MAYISLYRKYRPQTFTEVVGQDHVTQTLVNAIDEDRLHHAYLFTGPRGTGKTSTARILAKAINCVEGPTSQPCNDCEQCRAITTGSSMDVIELDMASHGGVDDARELRDRALFAPASARTKVYILDEVHMASTAAFNALLKLIEEPPGHVVFAMATTDPQKVLPTIMSRVQRLDLRRIAADDVAAHVREVVTGEDAEIDDAALDAVVRAGDGSARDTLSVLEQVLAFAGRHITAEQVAQVLGHTPAERVFEAVDAIASADLAALLTLVQGLLDDGHDLRRFTFDLLGHLRDLLVLQVAPGHPDLVDATDERRARLTAQAPHLPQSSLLRAVDLLAGTITEQRLGPARLPLELALGKLAVPAADGDVGALADRVARLERAAPESGPATDPTTDAGPAPAAPPAPVAEPTPPTETAEPTAAEAETSADDDTTPSQDPGESTAVPEDDAEQLRLVIERWAAVLNGVKESSRRIHAVFEPAQPVALARRILTLRYPVRYASFHATNARTGQYAETLQAAIERVCGLRLRIDAVIEGEDARRPMPPVVTPPDAVVADLDRHTPSTDTNDDTGDEAEAAAVREAELDVEHVEADDTEQLLATELGAELVDDHRDQRR